MKLYTLDKLVRGALASRGYTMHWYIQFLHYGVQALRELNFDVLQNVKSVRLPVSSYNAVTLPCDFVDYIRVGDELGQYILPWGERSDLNRLNKFNTSGGKIPYDDIEANNGLLPNNWESFWYANYTNDKGEHLGRIFNNKPSFRNSFAVLRERGEIQLDTSYTGAEIVLDYVTDGISTSASNAIHPYAAASIEAYIMWKMKEHGRQYGPGERQMAREEYYNQHRVLRGRMNNMDVQDIQRSLARNYGPTIRN